MQFRVVPMNETLVAGSKKNNLLVMYEIRVNGDEDSRNPYDLAIVLDKSGSMKGLSLMNALKAISNILDLMAIHDRLHFITYECAPDDEIDMIQKRHS